MPRGGPASIETVTEGGNFDISMAWSLCCCDPRVAVFLEGNPLDHADNTRGLWKEFAMMRHNATIIRHIMVWFACGREEKLVVVGVVKSRSKISKPIPALYEEMKVKKNPGSSLQVTNNFSPPTHRRRLPYPHISCRFLTRNLAPIFTPKYKQFLKKAL